jgi:hypothetical protein
MDAAAARDAALAREPNIVDRVCELKYTQTDVDGRNNSISWKAVCYNDGTVHLQLREVLLQCLDRSKCLNALDVGKFIKAEGFYRDLLAYLQLDGDVFFPSRTMARESQGRFLVLPKTRQEHHMRSDGVIGLLVRYSRCRRLHGDRRLAEASLVAGLSALEIRGEDVTTLFNTCIEVAGPECVAGVGANGLCAHMNNSSILKTWADTETPALWIVQRRLATSWHVGFVCVGSE